MFLRIFESFPALAVAIVIGFVVGITLHEAAHATSAYLLGDDTAYRMGRVTLNPASHLDLMGSIFLLLAGFGWGKPTPFTAAKLRYGVFGPVLVAVAGPVSNLLVLVVCGGLYLLPAFHSGYPQLLVVGMGFVNALLFVFNLVPIPPLDGSKIIFPFLPRALDGFVDFMNQYGMFLIFGVFLLSYVIPSFYPFNFILKIMRPLLQFFGLPTLF